MKMRRLAGICIYGLVIIIYIWLYVAHAATNL
jgi:hypothetical protein